MRTGSLIVVCVLLVGCMDLRMFPPADYGPKPEAIYHTGIEGQGVKVETFHHGAEYLSEAQSDSGNPPSPNPALRLAAERVAALSCPNGYQTVDTLDGGKLSYNLED